LLFLLEEDTASPYKVYLLGLRPIRSKKKQLKTIIVDKNTIEDN